jgi:DNA polymerase I
MNKKMILVDGNSIVFRAYFATAYPGATLMQTSKGEYTNALFAFINMFEQIVSDEDDMILVAFDTKEKTKRHEIYQDYKAGRAKMPEELASQLDIINHYLDVMGITHYRQPGYEADDIIGTLSKSIGYEIHIYSSDRDLLQLVSEDVTVHLLKKGMKEVHHFTPDAILETYELTHLQMIDLKGLMGDPSDNIPGIPGVGEKTAIKLLKTYGTLENVLMHADEIGGKLSEKIKEGHDSAILSKTLVTIDTQAILDLSLNDVKRKPLDQDQRVKFLQRYELHMLAKKVNQEIADITYDYIFINHDDTFLKHVFQTCAMHVELSDSNYHHASLWGVGIAYDTTYLFIDPSYALSSKVFQQFLENTDIQKYVYDAKAIYVFFKWHHIDVLGITFDLLLSSYIINAHLGKEEFNRVVSAFDYTGIAYEEDIYGKGVKKGLPTDQSHHKHIISKAKAIWELKATQDELLVEKNQSHLLYEVELPLAFVLGDMEFQGIHANVATLNDLGETLKSRIDILETTIQEMAGMSFNIASPKQLGDVLFDHLGLPSGKKTKTGYSTNVDVLEKLKKHHPIIDHILTYRSVTKLYSTYIEGLRPYILDDGKIHTIYMQALTTTGRLSSTDPNLQNIPIRTEEGRLIRQIFHASKDAVLLGADYSQIELRVLADMANVEALIESFNNHEDIHEQTAKKVFHVDTVSKEQRRQAKAVNFGIIYGISAWSLADDIHVSQKEAQQFIDTYLTVYPEIKAYMDNTVAFAKKHGYVETILKRRRYIPELTSSVFMQRAFGERTAMNAPIQGSAADIIKLAMIQLHHMLKKEALQSSLILQVHDELILNVYHDEIQKVSQLVEDAMQHAIKMQVSLDISMDTGHTWYEVK